VTGRILRTLGWLAAAALALGPVLAYAQDIETGQPKPGEITLQPSVTPIMDSIHAFHDGVLMWVVTAIVVLVLALLIIVMVRFNAKRHPIPSRTTHNTLIEVLWTVLPILILVVIAIPSFSVLTDQLTIPDGQRKYLGSDIFSFGDVAVPAPGLTVKATGQQWYWDYEYVDDGKGFSSNILSDEEDVKKGAPRLLGVDYELVVPVDTTVRVQVTADPAGVIHSFSMPAFGIKIDANPGRLNETWFYVRKTGMYYGQCSELCGTNHAFMPIAIRVVTQDQFAAWMAAFKAGSIDDANATLPALT
jgi:cytochrome c oxidase subunit 2